MWTTHQTQTDSLTTQNVCKNAAKPCQQHHSTAECARQCNSVNMTTIYHAAHTATVLIKVSFSAYTVMMLVVLQGLFTVHIISECVKSQLKFDITATLHFSYYCDNQALNIERL